jgi:hypothetical protein
MSYETAIKVDSEVHQYLFGKKERPSEPFNAALRRELGMPSPDDSESTDETTEESADADAAEEPPA